MTFKQELKKILHLHAEYYQSGEEGSLPLASASQAITDLVVELIGLDEEPKYAGENHLIHIEARNDLRAELKRKVTGQDSP